MRVSMRCTRLLRWQGSVIGALNAFLTRAGTPSPEQEDLLQAFADLATSALLAPRRPTPKQLAGGVDDAVDGGPCRRLSRDASSCPQGQCNDIEDRDADGCDEGNSPALRGGHPTQDESATHDGPGPRGDGGARAEHRHGRRGKQ